MQMCLVICGNFYFLKGWDSMKKTMKRSLALGALMAFVITGSAMANSIGDVNVDGTGVQVDANNDFAFGNGSNKVIVNGNSSCAVSLTSKNVHGTIDGREITLNGGVALGKDKDGIRVNSTLNVGGATTDTVSFIGGNNDGMFLVKSHVDIVAKNINISTESTGNVGAIWVQNNTQDSTAPKDAATVTLKADNINITSAKLGVVAFSNSQVNIEGNLVLEAKNAIDTRGNATVNINTDPDPDKNYTTVIKGDILFETPNTPEDPKGSGNLINSNVNINLNGKDSYWTGRAYQEFGGGTGVELDNNPAHFGNVEGFKLNIENGASWNMTGDSFINDLKLGENGTVNIQDGVDKFNAAVVDMNGGVVNMEGSKTFVNVGELKGDGATISTSSLDNKVNITTNNNKNVTVNGNGAIADQIAADKDKANDLANVVVSGDKTAANKVTTDEGVIGGRYEGTVDKNGEVTGFQAKNSTNTAISEMGSIALMAWRQENNDMNKRLGELRNSKGEHGIWTRMTRGESEFKSVKNQYNAYQIGYDEKLSTDKSWTVGAALTYTDAQSSFAGGSGENTHKGFAIYGSKLNEDGSFIDLIAKYARLEHEFDAVGGIGKGEYDTNGYSVSAEYGKRFDKGNGFWVEPQVELTYGKVGSVNYATKEAVAYQDGMESLVGRVGFSLGKDIKDGNVYVRASYLYDFDGETKVTMTNGTASDVYEQDLGGGWFEVGVGTNINLSDATYVYLDVEKTYGGDVATPWQWNAGVRYSF